MVSGTICDADIVLDGTRVFLKGEGLLGLVFYPFAMCGICHGVLSH